MSPRPIPTATPSSSLDVDGHRHGATPQPTVRPGQGFCRRGHVRGAAERAGRVEAKRLQDGGRSRCGGQGQSGQADFCLRWRRLLVAHGRRALAACRQHRRPARAVPRARPNRSDGGTHRLLFHSLGGCGVGARQRQACRACGELDEAGRLVARRAVNRRSWLSGGRVQLLGRIVGAGANPAHCHRQVARRRRRQRCRIRRCRKSWRSSASSRS